MNWLIAPIERMKKPELLKLAYDMPDAYRPTLDPLGGFQTKAFTNASRVAFITKARARYWDSRQGEKSVIASISEPSPLSRYVTVVPAGITASEVNAWISTLPGAAP